MITIISNYEEIYMILYLLNITSTIFLAGLFGIVINKKSIILTLLCIELMFLAASLNFILLGYFTHNLLGIIYGIFIIFVTTIDTCFGLSLVIINYKDTKRSCIHSLITLRG
jgi:NADH-quinone oxidoreductase subunit K